MPLQRKELNFKGENIYIGIDVHKNSFRLSIQSSTAVLKNFSSASDPDALVCYLHRNYPGATYYSVYEAGFCGVWIHNRLIELGVNNIVVNPCDVPCNHKDRERKTDAVDASRLAGSLRSGDLKGIYIHQIQTLHDRSLMRLRSGGVKDMTRLKNRIKGMLHYYGVLIPPHMQTCARSWSARFIGWLREEVLLRGMVAETALGFLLDEYQERRKRQALILKEIRILSRTPRYEENIKYICSISGIGLVSGMHLLVNIEDIHRFAGRDDFAGFMGFVPTCHCTGDKESTGKITRRAPKELRYMLTECAWIAMRNDPALSLKYGQLRRRMDENKAIVRIARKLCNRIYYVLKNKTEYVNGVVQ